IVTRPQEAASSLWKVVFAGVGFILGESGPKLSDRL
ncbi:hypothetical protein JMJ77_0004053, partial [Colletotrichum scovillei]